MNSINSTTAASASPPVKPHDVVKAETDDDAGEGKTTLLTRAHTSLSANAFLSLWRHTAAAAASASSPHLGTLAIGSVVFAPCRVQSGPPPLRGSLQSPSAPLPPPPPYRLHYALAEVTGIQAMAGTVTASFLFTEPGVDDEAISLYECIPCPPACLARWLGNEGDGTAASVTGTSSSACCSLLERVLRVPPEGSPLPVNDIFTTLLSSTGGDRTGCPQGSRLTAAQQRCAAHLRHLYCFSDDEDDEDGDGRRGSCKAGPAPPLKGHAGMADDDTTFHFSWQTCARSSSSSSSAAVSAEKGTTTVLRACYRAPVSLHVFFARVFQLVNAFAETIPRSPGPSDGRATWRYCGAPKRPPLVVLTLFDSYAALRRFHVYMTVRGHVVQLLDGTDSSEEAEERWRTPFPGTATTGRGAGSAVCRGGPAPVPRVRSAFGNECKVWLCMLREDTGEEDATGHGRGAERAIAAQLRRVLAPAPPIDILISFRERATGSSDTVDEEVCAELVLLELLPHLSAARLDCHLHDVPSLALRPAPASATSVVRVSGAIFGDRKLLVPCSPEQLTLLASVLASEPPPLPSPAAADARQTRSVQKRQRTVEAPPQALTPALLERIALGTFTDAAAAALFDAVADVTAAVLANAQAPPSPAAAAARETVVQEVAETALPRRCGAPLVLATVDDIYEKWCVDPARFGEAFPVFQAAYALIADVLRSPSRFRRGGGEGEGPATDPSSLPRIALVLPRGNPTQHPSLSTQQFLHTLRLFFAPWTLHEVPSATTTTTAVGSTSTNACVLWYQRGGLLLLFCDEPTTQLGALQDDADVVVACGKAAAAWVAANAASASSGAASRPAAVYFAVISEIEVVPPAEHATHLWLPITLRAPSLDAVEAVASVAVEDETAPQSRTKWPAADASVVGVDEALASGQGEVLWARLLSTVGDDGNAVAASTRASHSTTPNNGPAPLPSGRRFQHVDVLLKTLRQAVVLWRNLATAVADAPGADGAEHHEHATVAPALGKTSCAESPWHLLRALVKAIALTCATVSPVCMSDVVLVRRSDTGTT